MRVRLERLLLTMAFALNVPLTVFRFLVLKVFKGRGLRLNFGPVHLGGSLALELRSGILEEIRGEVEILRKVGDNTGIDLGIGVGRALLVNSVHY